MSTFATYGMDFWAKPFLKAIFYSYFFIQGSYLKPENVTLDIENSILMKTDSTFANARWFISYFWQNYFYYYFYSLIQIHQEGESPQTLKGDMRWWTFGFDEDSVNFCKCWMFHNISLTKLLFLLLFSTTISTTIFYYYFILLFTCSDPSRRRVTWNLKRGHLDVRHSILMKTVSNYVTFGYFITYLWLNYYYYYYYYSLLMDLNKE